VAKSPRQAMQSMPGMLSKLESDFQQRAKTIDPWLSVAEFRFGEMNQETQLSISPNLFKLIQSYLILFNFIQSDIVI
jgi:hypothetical protein